VTSPDLLLITELFHSIQGESTHAGRPCFFVRCARCPMRCRWCDTTYSFHGGTPMTVDEVMDAIRASGCKLVELTGGEPLAQPAAARLARRLLEAHYEVLVETGGYFPLDRFPDGVAWILDVKCPGSGMADRNHWPNLERLNPKKDEVKFVVADQADYEWSRRIIDRHDLFATTRAVLFSPVWGELNPADLAAWILRDRIPARLQLPLHKIIWGPERRGV